MIYLIVVAILIGLAEAYFFDYLFPIGEYQEKYYRSINKEAPFEDIRKCSFTYEVSIITEAILVFVSKTVLSSESIKMMNVQMIICSNLLILYMTL